jgi:cellulose synthase/poly-beta-1,6-N-acetylglucosamine synthase-like glycosyltransferase
MEVLKYIILIIECIIFFYLGFATLYIFIFGVAGLFRHSRQKAPAARLRKIAVLVPGYKEDNVIIETARQSLNQTYPKSLFDVYIIADSFRQETIDLLKTIDVNIIEVSFDESTKAKALNTAMSRISKEYETAVVLDADNIMAPDFLDLVNQAFENGITVLQGHRIAKNTNTYFAILDAISEEINNHIFRKGHRVLGLPSALIGSGMAFSYGFYKTIMKEVTAKGEDKELEIKLLKNSVKIEYLHEAYVWDEKIQKAEVFARQRRRWLSAQIVILRSYFGTGLWQLVTRGNIGLFDKVLQTILPPRVMHFGTITLLTTLFLLMRLFHAPTFWFPLPPEGWFCLWTMTFLALLFSVPRKFYNRDTLKAIKILPRAFLIMFSLLFKLKGADRKFIHTEHGTHEKKN